MKLSVRLGAIVVMEWWGFIEVPDDITDDQKEHLLEYFYDKIESGDYKMDSWERGDLWTEKVDDSTDVTHQTPQLCHTCGAETSLGDTCHDCSCFDCERCGKMIDFDDDITVFDAKGCELKICEACLRNDDRMVEGSFSEAQRIPTDIPEVE